MRRALVASALIASLLVTAQPVAAQSSSSKSYNVSRSFTFTVTKGTVYRVRIVLAAGGNCQNPNPFDECSVKTNLTMTNKMWSTSSASRLAPSGTAYSLAACAQKRYLAFDNDPTVLFPKPTGSCGPGTTMNVYSYIPLVVPLCSAGGGCTTIGDWEQNQWATYVSGTSVGQSDGSVSIYVPMQVSLFQLCKLAAWSPLPGSFTQSGAALRAFVEARSPEAPWTTVASSGNLLIGNPPIATPDCAWIAGSGVLHALMLP